MKKLLIALLGFSLISCATFGGNKTNQYSSDEFTTENYQKRIDKIISNSDSLPDFASLKDTNNNINATDLATLMQADVFFNQGNYINALPLYENLADTYKNPKIIYKTIVCYERSGNANLYPNKVNKLTNLFIKSAPNTNIALILEVREYLYSNNIANAELKLGQLLDKEPDNTRTYLLFLSAVIGNSGLTNINVVGYNQFAKFVETKYSQYPESYLLSAIIYAITNNVNSLNNTLLTIKNSYPLWQLPMIWCTNILSNHGQYNSIIVITKPYVVDVSEPDWITENIYIGALINNNQSNIAIDLLKEQKKSNLNNPNIDLNLGLINAKNKNYLDAVKYLSQVNLTNVAMTNLVNVYLGLVSDLLNNREQAVIYYSKIHGNVLVENIANVMLINDYNKLGQKDKIDAVLTQMAQDKNLTGLEVVLFKARYYMSVMDYTLAYNLLKDNYVANKKNKDYVYLYANSLAMANHVNDAIKMYQYYLKLDPKSSNGYNDLAYVYVTQTKNYKLALKYAKKAAQINITDYNILDTLGWVYYKEGDNVAAYPLIYSSYQQMPTQEVSNHLKAVLLALNKPELANKISTIDAEGLENNITSLLTDKVLSLMMLLQYGTMGNNQLLNNDDTIDDTINQNNE